jgi:hypothetical protein
LKFREGGGQIRLQKSPNIFYHLFSPFDRNSISGFFYHNLVLSVVFLSPKPYDPGFVSQSCSTLSPKPKSQAYPGLVSQSHSFYHLLLGNPGSHSLYHLNHTLSPKFCYQQY